MKKETTNKSGLLIYAMLAIVLLGLAAYGFFEFRKQHAVSTGLTIMPDSTTHADNNSHRASENDSLQKEDSLIVPKKLPIAYDGDNEPWSAYRIIGSSEELAALSLTFNTKVWVDDRQSDEVFKAVLMVGTENQKKRSLVKLQADLLIEEHRFEKYRSNFSLAPFATLSSGVKKILLDDNYSDGNTYSLTQNEARAKSAVAFGDFDEDGMEDIAVIMDNNEKQISRLLILCINKMTQQPYIAFAENYADKMRIRSFKKGAKIYMDSREFVPAPRAGIVLTAEDIVLAIVYDVQAQKFKTYFQE